MVRVGQTVSVKVLEVDVARKRVALTMRLNDTAAPARRSGDAAPGRRPSARRGQGDGGRGGNGGGGGGGMMNSAMADAFAKLALAATAAKNRRLVRRFCRQTRLGTTTRTYP